MTVAPKLRLASVSDSVPPPRRTLTTVTLGDIEGEHALHVFGQFAVMLRENYAISVNGITHLLPANVGKHRHG